MMILSLFMLVLYVIPDYLSNAEQNSFRRLAGGALLSTCLLVYSLLVRRMLDRRLLCSACFSKSHSQLSVFAYHFFSTPFLS